MCKDANNTTAPACKQCGRATKFYVSSGLAKPFCSPKCRSKFISVRRFQPHPTKCIDCGEEFSCSKGSKGICRACRARMVNRVASGNRFNKTGVGSRYKCFRCYKPRLIGGNRGIGRGWCLSCTTKETKEKHNSRAASAGMLLTKTAWKKCDQCGDVTWRPGQGKCRCYKLRTGSRGWKLKQRQCIRCDRTFYRAKQGPQLFCDSCRSIHGTVQQEYRAGSAASCQHKSRPRPKMRPFTKWEVFDMDNYRCYLCFIRCNSLQENLNASDYPTLEHVIPLSRGGLDDWENCRCACRQCNSRKTDRTPREYFELYLVPKGKQHVASHELLSMATL